MNLRLPQFAALLVLAACGSSAPTSAQNAGGSSGPANLAPTDPPFTSTAIATFDNPWAMAFLPGGTTAIVTEKPGRVWLVDSASGHKLPVRGAPRVQQAGTNGQGGLLDVVLSPHFGRDGFVYLTYSEPSQNGGSELALARARWFAEPHRPFSSFRSSGAIRPAATAASSAGSSPSLPMDSRCS